MRVLVDGELFAAALEGTALPIDPGRHTLRYELEGAPAIEETVLIHEGEKNRTLAVRFQRAAAKTSTAVNLTPPAPAARGTGHPVPLATYLLGGTGLLAIGGFAFFGSSARQKYDDLQGDCAPACSSDALSSGKTHALAADISLIAGVLLLGAATWTFLAADGEP